MKIDDSSFLLHPKLTATATFFVHWNNQLMQGLVAVIFMITKVRRCNHLITVLRQSRYNICLTDKVSNQFLADEISVSGEHSFSRQIENQFSGSSVGKITEISSASHLNGFPLTFHSGELKHSECLRSWQNFLIIVTTQHERQAILRDFYRRHLTIMLLTLHIIAFVSILLLVCDFVIISCFQAWKGEGLNPVFSIYSYWSPLLSELNHCGY